MRSLLLLLSFLAACAAYKMLIIAPAMANSQVMFNKRVAEALSSAGHNVSIALIFAMEGLDPKDIKIPESIEVYPVNASSGMTKKEMEDEQAKLIFEDVSFFDSRMKQRMAAAQQIFLGSCRKMLENKKFMKWLKDSHFDLAFAHMYHACPLGIAYHAGIPTIWMSSGGLIDYMATISGVPIIPSYVPPMLMAAHDTLNFVERTKSLIGHTLMYFMWPYTIANPETKLFRELIDPNFPDLIEIGANCSLVMVNSNPFYDLPRPTLAKVVNIGGIGAQLKDAKPLPEELEKFVQQGEGVVVLSFGSIAPIHKAPESWKNAILGAFGRLSQYQFVMRYMGDDLNSLLPRNVKIMKWLPQSDLLQHPRVKAFISHGGYNGMQETIAAGKPIIMIPLFGDQPKNAKVAEKIGIAKVVEKADVNEDTLAGAIREIISNPSYSNSVQRISKMVAHQPVSPEHMLVKYSELLAEFKHLDNLRPAGQKLNFFQYHSLDVIAALLAAVFLILYLIFAILRLIARKIYRCVVPQKTKKD